MTKTMNIDYIPYWYLGSLSRSTVTNQPLVNISPCVASQLHLSLKQIHCSVQENWKQTHFSRTILSTSSYLVYTFITKFNISLHYLIVQSHFPVFMLYTSKVRININHHNNQSWYNIRSTRDGEQYQGRPNTTLEVLGVTTFYYDVVMFKEQHEVLICIIDWWHMELVY